MLRLSKVDYVHVAFESSHDLRNTAELRRTKAVGGLLDLYEFVSADILVEKQIGLTTSEAASRRGRSKLSEPLEPIRWNDLSHLGAPGLETVGAWILRPQRIPFEACPSTRFVVVPQCKHLAEEVPRLIRDDRRNVHEGRNERLVASLPRVKLSLLVDKHCFSNLNQHRVPQFAEL